MRAKPLKDRRAVSGAAGDIEHTLARSDSPGLQQPRERQGRQKAPYVPEPSEGKSPSR